ncbi:hypothetical protein [Flavobacterium covae]|uniref:hypothetical protein n=1 Tax=Flavobacterium covae TaxID=2906076 RepID=UPI00339682B3
MISSDPILSFCKENKGIYTIKSFIKTYKYNELNDKNQFLEDSIIKKYKIDKNQFIEVKEQN